MNYVKYFSNIKNQLTDAPDEVKRAFNEVVNFFDGKGKRGYNPTTKEYWIGIAIESIEDKIDRDFYILNRAKKGGPDAERMKARKVANEVIDRLKKLL